MGFLKVSMQGYVKNVDVRTTQAGKKFVKGKFIIPMEAYNGDVYEKAVNVSAWEEVADVVEALREDIEVTAEGSLRTSSYDGKCPHCGDVVKNYWTEVVIDDVSLVE